MMLIKAYNCYNFPTQLPLMDLWRHESHNCDNNIIDKVVVVVVVVQQKAETYGHHEFSLHFYHKLDWESDKVCS